MEKTIALFDAYTDIGNVGGDETDLYSFILKGGTLSRNGDKMCIRYVVDADTVASFSSAIYFGESTLVNQGSSLGLIESEVFIIRVSNDKIRYTRLNNYGGTISIEYHEIVSLDLEQDYLIRFTGKNSDEEPENDTVVAKFASIILIPSA